MNEGIKKFRELLLTDEEFRQKLKAATEAYTGEQTNEAVFEGVLVPLAAEYGISCNYEEFASYIEGMQNEDSAEIQMDELSQIAGGNKGFGLNVCYVVGIGAGSTGDTECVILGNGGGPGVCVSPGVEA